MQDSSNAAADTDERFPTDIAGLAEAGRPESVELADGQEFGLRISPVLKRLGTRRCA